MTNTVVARWKAIAVIVMAATLATSCEKATSAEVSADDSNGEVIRVIDGDTLSIRVDGTATTVRLLNIDTPETNDPNEPVQCLGPEATEWLKKRLPAGTEVELQYDEERTDRYDRTLAGVFESDSLINAEIAGVGLGVPVYFEPNKRFLPDVEAAYAQAERDEIGLFDPAIDCTLSAQVTEYGKTVGGLPTTVAGDPADALTRAEDAVTAGDTLIRELDGGDLSSLGNAVMTSTAASHTVESLVTKASEARRTAKDRRSTLSDRRDSYDKEQRRIAREGEERRDRQKKEKERTKQPRQVTTPTAHQQPSSTKKSPSGTSVTRPEKQSPSPRPTVKHSARPTTRPSPSPTPAHSTGSTNSSGSHEGKKSGTKSSSCVPYGPPIPYSNGGGYTGKRYGLPGGKAFRKCR